MPSWRGEDTPTVKPPGQVVRGMDTAALAALFAKGA